MLSMYVFLKFCYSIISSSWFTNQTHVSYPSILYVNKHDLSYFQPLVLKVARSKYEFISRSLVALGQQLHSTFSLRRRSRRPAPSHAPRRSRRSWRTQTPLSHGTTDYSSTLPRRARGGRSLCRSTLHFSSLLLKAFRGTSTPQTKFGPLGSLCSMNFPPCRSRTAPRRPRPSAASPTAKVRGRSPPSRALVLALRFLVCLFFFCVSCCNKTFPSNPPCLQDTGRTSSARFLSGTWSPPQRTA